MFTVVKIVGTMAQIEIVMAIFACEVEAREYASGLCAKRRTAYRFYAARPFRAADLTELEEDAAAS